MSTFCNVVFAGTAVAVLAAGPALARPDTRTMSCEQAQQLVQSQGAVVMTTGANTYDRYVRQFGTQCNWPDVPRSSYVQTNDGRCPLFHCAEPIFLFPDRH